MTATPPEHEIEDPTSDGHPMAEALTFRPNGLRLRLVDTATGKPNPVARETEERLRALEPGYRPAIKDVGLETPEVSLAVLLCPWGSPLGNPARAARPERRASAAERRTAGIRGE